MRKAWAVCLAVVITVAMLLGGCGGAAQKEKPAEPGKPVKGGTLVIGRPAEVDTLDPHKTTSFHAAQLMFFLYDTLLTLDYDLKTIKPGLAQTWNVSSDGLVYTFNLRKDVKFHSGRPMKAQDVVWTFQRWVSPEIASPTKWQLGQVKEFRAPDDYTFEIVLEKPYSELPRMLTNVFSAVLDREMVEKYGKDFGLTWSGGTGPFKFVEWVRQDRLVLERNPDYVWGPDLFANKGPAYIDKIISRVIPEESTRLMELETKNVDLTYYIPLNQVDRIKKNSALTLLPVEPYLYTDYLGFKVTRPKVNDPRVRAAINYAIDKKEFVDTLLFGLARPAYNIVPPEAPDYWPGAEDIWPKFDLEKAKQLLEEAGWKVGPDGIRVKNGERLEINMYHLNTPERMEKVTLIQSMLRKAGIDLKMEPFDLSALWAALRTDKYDMFYMNYPVSSTLAALAEYFWSGNVPAPNRMAWQDKTTDELILKAQEALTPEAKFEACKELQKIVAQNYLWVPLFHGQSFVAHTARVHGVKPHGIYGVQLYKLLDAWVEQ